MNPMKKKDCRRGIRLALLGLFLAGPVNAAEYWLCVGQFNTTMPDTGESVPLWGYALETDNSINNGCQSGPRVPGPALRVPANDTNLVVHLRNNLVGVTYSENVSIVIPGLVASMNPEFVTDSQGRERVNSLTNSVAPGASATYTWSNIQPGTYLYHSGTHPQVQVPMGLYGPMRHVFSANKAYPGVFFRTEATLLFSEIDPVYNNAIANGRFGAPSPTGEPDPNYPSSAISYRPQYFLINGRAYDQTTPIDAVVGRRTLLRFLNAGLDNRSPVLQGTPYMEVVAEDGNKLPYPQQKYNVFLPPMKTMDAIVTPAAVGRYPLYDRRLGLTNSTILGGGMLTYLNVTP